MASPKTNFHRRWVVLLGASLLVVVLTALVADQLSLPRIDLTRGGVHSVSQETRTVLGRLEDRLTITYTVSRRLPAQLESLRRDTVDYLREYQRASGGRVVVEVVDPERLIEERISLRRAGGDTGGRESFSPFSPVTKSLRDEVKEELTRIGVMEQQGQFLEQDRIEVFQFYSSITFKYLDRRDAIPFYQTLVGLEYELANRIVKLTLPRKPRIAFLLGRPDDVQGVPGEDGPGAKARIHPFQPFLERILANLFEVVEFELNATSPIPEDTKLLFLAEPDRLSPRQLYEIDRFIVEGGSALILLSRTTGGFDLYGIPQQMPLQPTVERLLNRWGITLRREVLCSQMAGSVPVRRPDATGSAMTGEQRSPLIPAAMGRGLNAESPLTQGLPYVLFPFATPLEHDPAQLEEWGLDLTVLARSDERSWLAPWSPQLIESYHMPPVDDATGQWRYDGARDLSYFIEGQFPSAFSPGDAIPAWASAGGSAASPETIPVPSPRPGRVILAASGDMAKAQFLQSSNQTTANVLFLRGAAEVLALGSDLVKIYAKTAAPPPLRETQAWERDFVRRANIFGIPLLVLALGLLRYGVRSLQSRRHEERVLRRTAGEES